MRSTLFFAALTAAAALSAPALAEPDAKAGEEAYAGACSGCHSSFAPNLKGVAGRKIASLEGTNYSDALKAKKEESWDDAHLDAFLKAPGDFAPGTPMFMGAPDDATRANIIAYLKTLK